MLTIVVVDSYYQTKDKNDVYEYWLYLLEAGRVCEANGVEKALELITLLEDLNIDGKGKEEDKRLKTAITKQCFIVLEKVLKFTQRFMVLNLKCFIL